MNQKRKQIFLLISIFTFLTLIFFQNSFSFKHSKEVETAGFKLSIQEIIGKLAPGKIAFSKERPKKEKNTQKTAGKTGEKADLSKRRREKKKKKADKILEQGHLTKQSREEKKKKVYLTFDDGPSENTDKILNILSEFGVKATFFVIGRSDKAALKRYKKIVDSGHTIGLHSYTHNYKQIYANLDAFMKDYFRISNLVYKATGVRSHYYRFPGGSSNTVSPSDMQIFADFLRNIGTRYYDWNVQCGDAVRVPPEPEVLYQNVIWPIKNSKLDQFIVLIHDSKPMKNSVKALPSILKWLQDNNYEILPIDDETLEVHHRIVRR